jgi:hypothetical protein
MVPPHYLFMNELPRRPALHRHRKELKDMEHHVAPRTLTEEILADLWVRKQALGREIPVLDLFRFPTVAALARHLGGEEAGHLQDIQKVQGLAEQQRAAQQRQRAAMERLRSPGKR